MNMTNSEEKNNEYNNIINSLLTLKDYNNKDFTELEDRISKIEYKTDTMINYFKMMTDVLQH